MLVPDLLTTAYLISYHIRPLSVLIKTKYSSLVVFAKECTTFIAKLSHLGFEKNHVNYCVKVVQYQKITIYSVLKNIRDAILKVSLTDP